MKGKRNIEPIMCITFKIKTICGYNNKELFTNAPLHQVTQEYIDSPTLHRVATNVPDCESLDKVLVKHVSRLEKEKTRSNMEEEWAKLREATETSIQKPMKAVWIRCWLSINPDWSKKRWLLHSSQMVVAQHNPNPNDNLKVCNTIPA